MQHFYGAAEAIQVGGYVDSLLRYKRVMSEEQLEVGGLPQFENLEI